MSNGPYATAALRYLDAGWSAPLPLPNGAKLPPPNGFTGVDPHSPARQQVERWVRERPDANVCLRLGHACIGVDVDLYRHTDARARLEELLGAPLPATVCSTNRGDGSGIYLYRVPPLPKGKRWRHAPIPGVEIIQRRHRYAVVWPSVHPSGRQYRWYGPNGELLDEPPTPDDLAFLDRYEPLLEDEPQYDQRPAADFELTGGEPSPTVRRLAERGLAACSGDKGSRHDTVRDTVAALVRAAEQGEPGVAGALDELGQAFVAAVAPDRPGGTRQAEREYADLRAGAVALIGTTTPKGSGTTGDARERIAAADHDTAAVRRLPRPPMLIDAWLPLDAVVLLYGPSGLGKSFLALSWALHTCHGISWQGHTVHGGPVVYVIGEGLHGLGRRIDAWEAQTRHRSEAHQPHWIGIPVNLFDRTETNALAGLVAEWRPALVVFDTLARCSLGAEENAAKDTALVVDGADTIRHATGSTVVLVHHTGKDGDRGARGSSALRGSVDVEAELTGEPDALTLRCTKQRDAPAPTPLRLSLTPVDGTDSAALVEGWPVGKLPQSAQLALAALRQHQVPEGLTTTAWIAVTGLPERSFYRARALLLEEDYCHNIGSETRPRYVPRSFVPPAETP